MYSKGSNKVTTEQSKTTEEFTTEENATPITNTPSGIITVKMVDQQFNAQDLEAFLKKVKSRIYKFPGREDVIEQITKSPDEDPDEEEDEETTPRIVAQPQIQNTNKAIIAIISVMAIAIILYS